MFAMGISPAPEETGLEAVPYRAGAPTDSAILRIEDMTRCAHSLGEQFSHEFFHALAGIEVFLQQRLDLAGDDFAIPGLIRRVAFKRTEKAVADAKPRTEVSLLLNHRVQGSDLLANPCDQLVGRAALLEPCGNSDGTEPWRRVAHRAYPSR